MADEGGPLGAGCDVPDLEVAAEVGGDDPRAVGAHGTTQHDAPGAGEGADEGVGFPEAGVAVDPRPGSGAAAPFSLGGKTVGQGLSLPLEPVVQLLPEELGALAQDVALAAHGAMERRQRRQPVVCRTRRSSHPLGPPPLQDSRT